ARGWPGALLPGAHGVMGDDPLADGTQEPDTEDGRKLHPELGRLRLSGRLASRAAWRARPEPGAPCGEPDDQRRENAELGAGDHAKPQASARMSARLRLCAMWFPARKLMGRARNSALIGKSAPPSGSVMRAPASISTGAAPAISHNDARWSWAKARAPSA